MQLMTSHFGLVEFDESKKFFFEEGLPGLEDEREFALLSHEQSAPVCWLQSMVHPEIALPVLNPFLLCPTYSFDITDSDVEALGIEDDKDVFTINVVVIPKDPTEMTINLAAPIIVNAVNHQAKQIFVSDKRYKIKTKVSELLDQLNRGE